MSSPYSYSQLNQSLKSNLSSQWVLFLPSGAAAKDGLYVTPGGDIRELDDSAGQINYGFVRLPHREEMLEIARWRSFDLGSVAISIPDAAAAYIDPIFRSSCPLPIQRRFGVSGDNWILADHLSGISWLNRRSDAPTASGPLTDTDVSILSYPAVFSRAHRLINNPPLVVKVSFTDPLAGVVFCEGDSEQPFPLFAVTFNSTSNSIRVYQSDDMGTTWTQINVDAVVAGNYTDSRIGVPYCYYNRIMTYANGSLYLPGPPPTITPFYRFVHYDIGNLSWTSGGDIPIVVGFVDARKIAYAGDFTQSLWLSHDNNIVDTSNANGMEWENARGGTLGFKVYDIAAAARWVAIAATYDDDAVISWHNTENGGWASGIIQHDAICASVGADVHNNNDPTDVWLYACVIVESEDPRYIGFVIYKNDMGTIDRNRLTSYFADLTTVIPMIKLYEATLDLWGSATPPDDLWAADTGTVTTQVTLNGYHVWVSIRMANYRRVILRSIDGGISWTRFDVETGSGTDDDLYSQLVVSPRDPNVALVIQETS